METGSSTSPVTTAVRAAGDVAIPGATGPLGRLYWLWAAVAVAVVALLLRAVHLYELHDTLLTSVLVGDGRTYDAWAQRIAAGDWMGSEVFYQAPLYPYLLAAVYRLLGHDLLLVRVMQSLMGAASCGMLVWVGRRFLTTGIGVAAGLMLAALPPALFFDALIQKASLDLFLLTLMLGLIGEFLARRSWPWLLAAGLVLGLLALNRENARVLAPVVAGWLIVGFSGVARRRRTIWCLIFAAGLALPLALVGWRNWRVGGEFLVSTSQLGPNFYIGNHAGADGRYAPLLPGRGDPIYERVDATRLAEQAEGRRLTPREVSNHWLGRAMEDIGAQPARWLRLMAWKTLLTFHAHELVDVEGINAYRSASKLLNGFSALYPGFGLICPLAALGLWVTRRRARLGLLYAIAAALAVSVTLFFVFARYRVTLTPILILFAAAGLLALPGIVGALRRRRWSEASLPGLAAMVVVALATNWPLTSLDDWDITYLSIGGELMDANRLDEAIDAFDRVLATRATSAFAYHNKGVAMLKQHRDADAEQQFRLALRHDATFAPTYVVLGRLLRDTGRLGEAEAHLRTGADLVPEELSLRNEHVQVLLALGRTRDAAQAMRNALARYPDAVAVANDLAWLLATAADERVRDGAEAVRLAEANLRRVGRDDPQLLNTLAAAYAQVGRFEEAVSIAEKVLSHLTDPQHGPIASQVRSQLRLYRMRQPHR